MVSPRKASRESRRLESRGVVKGIVESRGTWATDEGCETGAIVPGMKESLTGLERFDFGRYGRFRMGQG